MQNKRTMTIAVVAAVCAGAMLVASCGAGKGLGEKQQNEECEALAMQRSDGWRASGIGNDFDKEDSRSEAELVAKTRLAQQLSEQIEALRQRGALRHDVGGGDNTASAKGKSFKRVDEGYVMEVLRGVRTICSNSYKQSDGSYHTYVCVEMSDDGFNSLAKRVTEDEALGIDFGVKQFKDEMRQSKEEYRKNR
ncbi:hypothetical protein FACS189452_10610 [Bacteroidia bacterium]|nr:hypothetical protein FACS189452_10610 [Bacteroidia bacterium]